MDTTTGTAARCSLAVSREQRPHLSHLFAERIGRTFDPRDVERLFRLGIGHNGLRGESHRSEGGTRNGRGCTGRTGKEAIRKWLERLEFLLFSLSDGRADEQGCVALLAGKDPGCQHPQQDQMCAERRRDRRHLRPQRRSRRRRLFSGTGSRSGHATLIIRTGTGRSRLSTDRFPASFHRPVANRISRRFRLPRTARRRQTRFPQFKTLPT